MRKYLYILLSAALAALSCTREHEEPLRDIPFPEGEKVTLTFTVNDLDASESTKALGEDSALESLHVAVFGSSGYLKEYVKANLVKKQEKYEYHYTDDQNIDRTADVDQYTFSVTLTLSEGKRKVHLIGNGPSVLDFGYDTSVLPSLLSGIGSTAFWAMIELPNGIRARKGEDGFYQTPYLPDEETENAFNKNGEGIALIRNWAKIEVSSREGSNFTPISFAVVNVPSRGTIVPYNAATGFIQDYKDLSFIQLQDRGYAANLPAGSTFDTSVPSKTDFQQKRTAKGVADANGGAVYLYERPVPENNLPPSFVIIYGHYKNEEDTTQPEGDYFYKVDLMEHGSYYPVYRNFKYKVVVDKITAVGFDTPEGAVAAAGSANVSADVNTSHLLDISDGTRRLVVSPWLAKTFSSQQTNREELSVLFFDDASGENPVINMDPAAVTCELLPPLGGRTDVITAVSIGDPSEVEGSRGWRMVSLSTIAPTRTVRTQTLRIRGTSGGESLYRDIVITVQPMQKMELSCRYPVINPRQDAPQVLDISIPDGLPQSMFPLDFIVEPENKTLSQDNTMPDSNIPVIVGQSISDSTAFSGKTTFQFIRTVSWSEYNRLPVHTNENWTDMRTFSCYFKTNCPESGTTIWVDNEYFDKASVSFQNPRSVYNLRFSTAIRLEEKSSVGVHFDLPSHVTEYPELRFVLTGLVPPDNNSDWTLLNEEEGLYSYTPSAHSVDLSLLTTTGTGEVGVEVYSEDGVYESQKITPYHFTNVGFVSGCEISGMSNTWSNVIAGYCNSDNKSNKNKYFPFGYCEDPDARNVTVTLRDINKEDAKVSDPTNSNFVFAPAGMVGEYANPFYREINLRSSDYSTTPIRFHLSAAGYVEVPVEAKRFTGDITIHDAKAEESVPSGVYSLLNLKVNSPNYSCGLWNRSAKFTFNEVSSVNTTEPTGVFLNPNKDYTFTVSNITNGYSLYKISFEFRPAYVWYGATRDLKPRSIEVSDPAHIFTYNRHLGCQVIELDAIKKGATITMHAAVDYPIVIQRIVAITYADNLTFHD